MCQTQRNTGCRQRTFHLLAHLDGGTVAKRREARHEGELVCAQAGSTQNFPIEVVHWH